MLTRQQHELLLFIASQIEATGVTPSFDEMKDHLDLASKAGVHRLVTALEERGYIRRLAHRARAIDVVKLPPTSHRRDGWPDLAGMTSLELVRLQSEIERVLAARMFERRPAAPAKHRLAELKPA